MKTGISNVDRISRGYLYRVSDEYAVGLDVEGENQAFTVPLFEEFMKRIMPDMPQRKKKSTI